MTAQTRIPKSSAADLAVWAGDDRAQVASKTAAYDECLACAAEARLSGDTERRLSKRGRGADDDR